MSKYERSPRKQRGTATKAVKVESNTRSAGNSKLTQLETMLRRPEGATITQLIAALDWQPHSVRAAISTLKKKRGLPVSAQDIQGGERTYRIAH